MQYQPNIENVQGQQNPAMMQGTGTQRVSTTNTPDPQFDLISVTYHALQGAQTYEVYAEDAKRNGDNELAQFFQQARQEQIACADQAKQLLNRRLGQSILH